MTIENNTQTANPYAAPDSELKDKDLSDKIRVFDRFSAWGVFGLMIITLGIYYYFWLYLRTKRINEVVENKISTGFVMTAIALTIFYYVGYFGGVITVIAAPALLTSYGGSLLTVGLALYNLASILLVIFLITWIFKVRNRINQVTGSTKSEKNWCGGIMTFFFHAIYLQYKINQNLDLTNAK